MPRITVIAHNIRSAHNIGAIFRSCEGFGVEHIIISGYTPYPTYANDKRLPHIALKTNNQINKTALGAETLVTFSQVDDIDSWLDDWRYPVVALERTSTSVSLKDFEAPDQFALLLGEEVAGISTELLKRCDYVVDIPMVGQKESFNVSVATGIALFALST